MQIKNKLAVIIVCFLSLNLFFLNLRADEFNIEAVEILVDKENDIIIGKGSVEATDKEGKLIKADKITYERSKEFLLAEGFVEIFDTKGNIIKTEKASYDKMKEIIISYDNTELLLKKGYTLKTDQITYDNTKQIVSSTKNSVLKDEDGNVVSMNMFQYQVEKNLFSTVGEIKIIDVNKNKYFFKELHVDTLKKEMIASDASALLDQNTFGVNKENDPRFVANDVFMSKDKSTFSKGVFTVCQLKEGRCPPWLLQAKKIVHDKIKKTIYYDHAILKFYDFPIFYFPKFFHPDPTVERQSGFLIPFFTNTTNSGTGFGLPYYWRISHDKDLTFTPKTYTNENVLFLNEYRQAYKNGFLTLDTSYTQGYKNTSSTKTKGSRNHIFAELDFDFAQSDSYDSELSFKLQRTSNDTYFRVHDINTALVDAESTNLENEISYNFSKNDLYLNITGTVYENLRDKTNSRYEYILPNILFGKSFFTEKFGILDFKSNALHKNYETNKHKTTITNDIVWSPGNYITKKGFVNTIEGLLKNTNYKAKNTTDFKNDSTVNELSGVLSFKSSLPMKKEETNWSKIFSPTFMLRYAPGNMRNLATEDLALNYTNLFETNKTSVIENGLSAILGFDFTVNDIDKNGSEKQKLSISMGQVFSPEKNKDMPSKSSLDRQMSDVVGKINYNFSEIGNIGYKFSLDHNLNDINYSEIATSLNFGMVGFNLDYLEEQNHVGNENYINAGISLNFNDNNKLSFETKKNFKTESTELYNISYQYKNDCLTAGLVYRREFYEDNDVEPKDTLMFKITFVPFGEVKTPSFVNP